MSESWDDPPITESASGGGGSIARELAVRLAILAVIIAGVYLVRPIFHGLIYSILYSPTMAVLGGGGILIAVGLFLLPPSYVHRGEAKPLGQVVRESRSFPELLMDLEGSARWKVQTLSRILPALFVIAIVVSVPANLFEQRTLAEGTMADAIEVDTFPQVNPDNPRVVPRNVADITTRGSVSYRQWRLGTSDIARMESGALGWSYPIEPDGLRNRIVEDQRGIVITDMTRLDDREIIAVEEDFTHGEGMFLYRSADWHLKLTDYIARYDDDAVEFSHEGTPYMYYPKTGHIWHLVPFPHTTPTWVGGALVHPDGTIEHLTPAEAQAEPILAGQRLYPLSITIAEMRSLGFRNGIVNQLPVVGAHEDEVEVARLPPGADNRQPFVIDLEGEQMAYVTAHEPYGADTRGLDEVWFTDADTGAYTYFSSERATYIGPERAMGIARSADSRTNWGQNFVVTEPVPVTIDGQLWWHMKVSPTDFTDVTRNVFVNAESSDTVEIRDDTEVRRFIAGEVDFGELAPAPEEVPDAAVAYYILIVDGDGEVIDRIPVAPGQETRIIEGTNETATAAG